MIKRLIAIFCVCSMILSMTACNSISALNQLTNSHDNASQNKTDNTDVIVSTDNEPSGSNNAEVAGQIDTPTTNDVPNTPASDSTSNSSSPLNSEISKIETIDELETVIENDVENTISALEKKHDELVDEIDSFTKYSANAEKIEAFYEEIVSSHEALCNRMNEYSYKYAELILSSGKSYRDRYNDLDDLYDCIYDSACDDIYDGVYDGILSDLYNDFYDGILDDAYDEVPYKEWSSARSDEYDWWSDSRSDVYKKWSGTHSDIYGFYSDIRKYTYRDDVEKIEKKMANFAKDIEKLY